MTQQLYRIRSGDLWYKGTSWTHEEQDGPIFTNRERALATIRRETRATASVVAAQPNYLEAADELERWKVAEIAEYQLVRIT